MPSNLTFPIIHHNMFLRKTKSAPILKPSSTFNKENDRLNRNVIYLQTMIDDMIQEYQYMDRPLKYPRCGSASHCETLSIAVASLSHQIILSQPPIAFTCSISLFAVFPLRTSPFW